MVTWIVFSLLVVIALAILAMTGMRARRQETSRFDQDMSVYRQQLEEIDSDLEEGLLKAEEAEQARLEVQRRILRADKASGNKTVVTSGRKTAVALAVFLPLCSFALYAYLGAPNVPDMPLAERLGATTEQLIERQDFPVLAARLQERLKGDPNNPQGWGLLARTYATMGDLDSAAKAMSQAAVIARTDPELFIQAGEYLMEARQGTVTKQAFAAFNAALTLEPGHPGAAFYQGVYYVQTDRVQKAFDIWLSILLRAPEDASYRELLKANLVEAAHQLGKNLDDILKNPPELPLVAAVSMTEEFGEDAAAAPQAGPTAEDMAAAQQMSAGDRQAMIGQMVQRLADRLKDNPDDFQGWMRLANAYQVMNRPGEAIEAFRQAVKLEPKAPTAMSGLAMALIKQTEDGQAMPEEAATLFHQLAALNPQDQQSLFYSGLAHAQTGAKDKAAEQWQRLQLLLDPSSENYKFIADKLQALTN